MCKKEGDFDKLFSKQLERLKTDRIDYYLIHMLCDSDTFDKLKLLNIIEWIEKKKKEGSIKNIGFSYHGGKNEFKKLIDSYNWDFCMIQYNYLDEYNQAGKEGLHYAYKKGIPVFVMEPLRGGMLVNGLPEKAIKRFNSIDKNRTLVEWSLRWIWNQKEVTMLLSGMNELKQLEENVQIANHSNIDSLTKKELDVYDKVLDETNKLIKIPCTGCSYCMPCPQGVDIPTCFSCYNETFTHSYKSGFRRYFMTTGSTSIKQSNASKCIKCKLCEEHCPQNIEISKRLTEVSKRMEPFWYRPVTSFIRKIMGIKVK
jgi:predicted aldo/keto reductase-like oxidoreductase